MITDPWTDKLSEYLDGELSETERAALERHLAACPTCTTTLADLTRVVARARALPAPPPAGDLWPGIAARLAAGRGPGVRPLDPARRARRWAFSLPQLAAAALAIAAGSGGLAWWAASRAATAPGVPIATPSGPPATLAAAPGQADYDKAVADLQRVLAGGRGALDTTTVRVLERNLAVIDRAIAEARGALAADPGSAYLNAHLAHTMRRKLDLLRQAAALAAAQS